ncbi:hypothetical protein CBR_g39148 [Chara braunii]|uniref:CCHC-type domain-containing protein n=1 Tax=Chara braunii TaxID=69332 RepID=A0A388LR75_CHABU|nr:hypothetical protein CBR_g39148 [Chara braunii]|eukprot:GBG84771.1 hypothetical protein CBR_g39148 [Chara braunii]
MNNGNNNGGNGNNGNGGYGGRNGITCYECGKAGHIARDCWSKRGPMRPNQQDDEVHVFVRELMEEKKEEKRKRIEDEQRMLKEEDDRRRELDIAKRTEEMKMQLQADIEEKWRRQQEEAANRAREERQEVGKEISPGISPQSKAITNGKAKRKTRRQTKKKNRGKTEARSSSSSDTSKNCRTSASESSEDSEEEARRIVHILRAEKQKQKPRKTQGRVRPAKRTPPSVYEKGECSRRSETPTAKGETVTEEPRTPLTGGRKGVSAGCSREGFVDYTLKVLHASVLKTEVRRKVESVIDKKMDDHALVAFVKKKVRMVNTRNRTVGEVIHNHRRHAHTQPVSCPCEHHLLTKKDGHILTRVSEIKNEPMFVRNAKNVTRPDEQNSKRDIIQGISMAIAHLKGRTQEEMNFDSCVKTENGKCAAWIEGEVRNWASKNQGLVLVPVDRNPGDTVLICPVLYRHGFGSTFTWNPDYESVGKPEAEVLARCKKESEEAGLTEIGRWKSDGKLGRSYVISKDKDLQRWRPIAPACNDPAVLVQRRGARALHCLVTRFSRRKNFHLKSTMELKEDLENAGEILSREGCDMAMGRCYNIKEMFSSISHASVKDEVSDLVMHFEEQGWRQVRVATRGKLCHMSKTDRKEPGFVTVKLDMIRTIVEYDVADAYMMHGGVVRKQIIGIPMGRTTSQCWPQ